MCPVCVGRLSADCRPVVDRLSIGCRPGPWTLLERSWSVEAERLVGEELELNGQRITRAGVLATRQDHEQNRAAAAQLAPGARSISRSRHSIPISPPAPLTRSSWSKQAGQVAGPFSVAISPVP